MELSNPDVMLQALDAERQLAQARADLINLRNTLKTQALAQQSTIATLHTDEADARRRAEALRNLQGVISEVELKQQLDRAQEMEKRVQIESERPTAMGRRLRAPVR